jgi:leader peptidase (prepilin peptidase)/N-methyltransferase
MGDGDVKLAGLIGLITGFPHVVVALVVGVLAGGLVALLLLLTKIKGRKSYIPYAPFLVIGGMVAMLYGPEIMAWYASLVHR